MPLLHFFWPSLSSFFISGVLCFCLCYSVVIDFKGRKNKMRKAMFVGKYYGRGCDAHMVYLVYGYRGHEYTVYESLAQGNESLSWQYRSEQGIVDRLVGQEGKEKDVRLCCREDIA